MNNNIFELIIDGEVKATTSIEIQDCCCEKSKPAKNFKQLVELVKQGEDNLILNGYDDVGDRISIIRGIYYGTEWSLDYNVEKSTLRNIAFNIPYTGSFVTADARQKLKCSEDCEADLFNSLYNSFEVFENKYKAIDFGHLIIGMDARRNWRAKTLHIPTQGANGLEICTWVGDLGGGAGKLSLDRVQKPLKRSKTLFPILGNSYGAMVNLEGDIAAYVVGMNVNNESEVDDPTNNFDTIHEALQDYFDNKWDKRAYYFLKMLNGTFDKSNRLVNREELVDYCTDHFTSFSAWYLGARLKDKGVGSWEDFQKAAPHFESVAKEVSSIFIDGLIHVVEKPKDMITARTDPDPKPKNTTETNLFERFKNKLRNLDFNPFD